MVRQCGLQIANICPVNPSYHASFPSIPQNAGILNWCVSNKVNRNPVKFSSSYDTSLYCMSLLIMGGIEVNPGPGSAKDLCGVCKQVCTWKEKAIACDECDTWYHTSCTGITSMEYSRLANTSVSWICAVCSAPNHSTVLYDLIDSADSNTFSALSIQDSTCGSEVTDSLQNSSFGDPIATSSPKRPANNASKKPNRKGIRILVVNFQSIKNKRTELPVLIESSQPDIIVGSETWLSDKIGSQEIFPPELGFDVIRRDRPKDPHGGVLIAAKGDLGLTQTHCSQTTELIAGNSGISVS